MHAKTFSPELNERGKKEKGIQRKVLEKKIDEEMASKVKEENNNNNNNNCDLYSA